MNRQPQSNPFAHAFLGGVAAGGAWLTRGLAEQGGDLWFVPAFLAFAAVISALFFLGSLPEFALNLMRHARAKKVTGKGGTAGWASKREIARAGLHKGHGYLAAVQGRRPIFVDVESSGMVLSPAGGGKTISFVVPALCHNPISMFVPDLKGTLACMTKELREKRHGHKTYCVNPAGLYESILGPASCYNPLQILIDDWLCARAQLYADAQAIARQLHPEPNVTTDNQYFRSGSRKILTFAFLYLVIMGVDATLSNALGLVSDVHRLLVALRMAKTTDHLDGDLARLAGDLLTKFEQADTRQIESFREGAVQALEVFAPSGQLARSTSRCDFRFRDLKDLKCTIYLIADPTRMKVYAPWLGLLSWCALTELIRYQNGASACFLADEITNFKIEGLDSQLTLAREFKIKFWLVLQELEQFAHVYGREALDTLLSQTEVKIFHGSRSQRTCALISEMLGEASIKALSHNIGTSFMDPVSRSVSEVSRRLLTPEEVRRSTDVIIFVRNLRPIRGQKIGYHEIDPFSDWVGMNPLFGTKLIGKTRLRLPH